MTKLLIGGPYETGLERDKEPFLLTHEAFAKLEDAFVWREKVIKRPGFVNKGRLRRVLATKTGTLALTQQTANAVTTTIADILADASINLRATEPNAEIEPGSVWIMDANGYGWNDATTNGVMTAVGIPLATDGTINYATGEIVLNYPGVQAGGDVITLIDFAYYPSLPVMGLKSREQVVINEEQTIAFDQIYAYRHELPGGWEELPSTLAVTWAGTDSDFFWTTNYRGTVSNEEFFYVTNFNQATGGGDPLYYYDPNAGPATWTIFNPTLNGANELWQARIIIPFKDRLVVFNTWEGATIAASVQYPQRARFSRNGDPTTLATAWLDNVVGSGGYIDCPTSEHIISAQIIKDRLIVFFERSTWEFVYTGNEVLPFVWQNINTELGSESTFSEVVFDEGLLGVGNTGIHSANIGGVKRIDVKIPDEVGKINNGNNGTRRVYGIRDFDNEVVYWTFPSFVGSPTFPNRVLLYNYRNDTWALFNDRFTCYGYFQKVNTDTWATLPYSTWSSWNVPWNAGVGQSYFHQIIAGNQQGYIHLFDKSGSNDISLSVTAIVGNLVTVPNHNLQEKQFVKFTDLTGITITPTVGVHSTQTFKITEVVTVNSFRIDGIAAGTYPGGGSITVLNNINIRTKNFALGMAEDQETHLHHLDFLFTKTSKGEVTLDTYINSADSLPIDPLQGTKEVRTRPEDNDNLAVQQNKIWHRAFRNLSSGFLQFQITLSDDQMRDSDIQTSDIELHAMLLDISQGGRM